jgi:polysaccharide biosynthesis protein PslG
LRRRARGAALGLLLAAVLAGALAGCGSGSGSSTPSAPRSTFIGLVSDDTFAAAAAYQNATFARQRELGVELLRQTFDWSAIEPAPGRFRFAQTDRFVLAAARQGLVVLPILFGAPRWATGRSRSPSANVVDPPRDAATFAAFSRALVRRYGPSGSLWRSHPGVARVPIRDWQVWNEPNLPQYWGDHPSAAGYAALLRAADHAIHAADKGARVVSAGLPESRIGVPFGAYVRAFYRAGARGTFDDFAVHPYSSSTAGVLSAVRRTRSLLRRYGDGSKPVWITEIGWASGGPRSPFTFDPLSQAQLIGRTIAALTAARAPLHIAGFVYFGWKDGHPYPGRSDFWGLHTGLLNDDGTPKPSLAAFRDAVQRAAE